MYKILKEWNGQPEATTIGKIYWVNESNYFKDNKNAERNAKHGVWEEDLSTVNLGYGYGPLSDDPLVNPKKAAGSVKAPMHTLPTLALIQIANVMAGGAHKYGYYNFRESKVDAQTYIGAMQRHFLKWQDGIDFDEESGQHELAHLAACCMIMIDAHYTGKFIDNRNKTGLVEKMLKDSEVEFNDFVVKHPKKDNK